MGKEEREKRDGRERREGQGRHGQRPMRTTSLARGIVWSYWWRRVLALTLANTLLAAALVGCFAIQSAQRAQEAGLASGRLAFRRAAQPLERLVYDVALEDGEHLSYALADYVHDIAPLVAVIGACEVVSLVALPFSTRRVRRKLQPLNDLALAANELANAAPSDAAKFQSLEQAIHSASVDSPYVSTGDKDLQSIEVALNGLLRQMQEARLQQMRFVSDASHELRTPISVIQGYVNMLDRWGKTDEDVLDESIAALKAESQHMQDLVEQLLFLARGDTGRNVLQREHLNLAATLEEVWEESRMIDEEHLYTLDVPAGSVQDERFVLEGDVGMVKQVARILIQNSAAYAPAGTPILLAVLAGKNEVSFSVQDEGIGMSAEDAARVFDRFYRAEGARSLRGGGTGLGLAIAKWIVDAHGGSIEVLSREGVGTRFTVHLPCA